MKEENPSFDLTKCVLKLELWDPVLKPKSPEANFATAAPVVIVLKTVSHVACRDFGHRQQQQSGLPTWSGIM